MSFKNSKNSFVKNQSNKLTNVVLSDLNFPSLNDANISTAMSSLNFIEKVKFEPIVEIKIERNPEYVYYTTNKIPVKQEPPDGKPKWAYFGSTWQLETVETVEKIDDFNPDFSKMINNWENYKTNFVNIYGEDFYDNLYKFPYEEIFDEDEEDSDDEYEYEE